MTAIYILNIRMWKIEFTIWQRNEGQLFYTSVKARY